MNVIAILCLVLLILVLIGFVLGNWLLAAYGGQSVWESMMMDLTMPVLYGGPLVVIGLTAQMLHQRKQGKRLWPYIILLALCTPVIIWGILDSL